MWVLSILSFLLFAACGAAPESPNNVDSNFITPGNSAVVSEINSSVEQNGSQIPSDSSLDAIAISDEDVLIKVTGTVVETSETATTEDVPPDNIEIKPSAKEEIFSSDKISLTDFWAGKKYSMAGNAGAVIAPVDGDIICVSVACSSTELVCNETCQALDPDGSFQFIVDARPGDSVSVFLGAYNPIGFNLETRVIPLSDPISDDTSTFDLAPVL